MPKIIGTVEALTIRDQHSKAPVETRAFVEVSLEGIVGDVHSGFSRPSDGRDKGVVRGTPVRNWRQWSAVSKEELEKVAKAMGVAEIPPGALSANLVFSGISNFTQLTKGSSIWFQNGVVLAVEEENEPCVGPGKELAAMYAEIKAHDFVKAAVNLRGLVGVVYRAGIVTVGEQAEVKMYQPKTYQVFGNPLRL